MTLDQSYLNSCANDVVGIEAVAMANKNVDWISGGEVRQNFLLKGIYLSVNLSLRNSDYTLSPYGYVANVTMSGIWLLTFGRHFI